MMLTSSIKIPVKVSILSIMYCWSLWIFPVNWVPNGTSTVTINARRKYGGEKSFYGVVNDDGTVTVPLTYWMLELEGTVDCDISVIDAEDKKLSTTKFVLEVEKASCKGENIEVDDDCDVVVKLIEDVNELKEKMANVSATDQEYNPTSENAQSGKAVAEAIEQNIETYELIEDITLTEDISQIERTVEPNGTPYNFRKVMVLYTSNAKVGEGNIETTAYSNDKSLGFAASKNSDTTNSETSRVEFEANGVLKGQFVQWRIYPWTVNNVQGNPFIVELNENVLKPINEFDPIDELLVDAKLLLQIEQEIVKILFSKAGKIVKSVDKA